MEHQIPTRPRGSTLLLLSVTLIAFAANSVLCRQGLLGGSIDAVSFTAIRLLSGALTLGTLLWLRHRHQSSHTPFVWSPAAALCLFGYALLFSLAYLELNAGTGALILFGSVQLTMIGYGILAGSRPAAAQWLGILLAVSGLCYLLLPGATAPPLLAAGAMALAGAAWGGYSLIGRGSRDALASTAMNFTLALPLALLVSLAGITERRLGIDGALYAIASGALASGCGYAIWYRILPHLSPVVAATVQLAVPVLAALGGVIWIAEPISARLVASGLLTLGGIALVIVTGSTERTTRPLEPDR